VNFKKTLKFIVTYWKTIIAQSTAYLWCYWYVILPTIESLQIMSVIAKERNKVLSQVEPILQ